MHNFRIFDACWPPLIESDKKTCYAKEIFGPHLCKYPAIHHCRSPTTLATVDVFVVCIHNSLLEKNWVFGWCVCVCRYFFLFSKIFIIFIFEYVNQIVQRRQPSSNDVQPAFDLIFHKLSRHNEIFFIFFIAKFDKFLHSK